MLFNSLQFLVFFMVVTLLFFQIKNQKGRVWLLLLSSCYFYMSFIPKYILILGFTIIIDYLAGLQIERTKGKSRKFWLVLSIIANVGILAYYKYFNFLAGNLITALGYIDVSTDLHFLEIILPIGLSFHTFQAMSYTIEVYRGNQPAERNFVTYALYVMFYPQLVAGPIERPQNVLPQLHRYTKYNGENVKEGLSRMLWGLFKKVVIADRLALAVDYTFANTSELSSFALIIGAVLYSFQIYCDFSGYSDIGIGAARVMNIKLMENFNQPYLSRSVTTFWSRWHISLSTWFRDYVYIPLGGNRRGEGRRKFNVFIVFLLSGLWHGANWTFVLWGIFHGLMVILFPSRRGFAMQQGRLFTIAATGRVLINFLIITVFWVFFRAENVQHAFTYLQSIFLFQDGYNKVGLNNVELLFSFLLIGIMLWRERYFPAFFIRSNRKFALYVALIVIACYFFGVFEENQFIYFQF